MQFPAIDPVAFSIGSLQLRWYGLMYLLAFFVGWGLARWRASRPGSGWKTVDVDDLLTFVMLGVILGARLGYVLFYDLPAYIDDPGEILRIWNGGMSFHGGLLGVLCAFWYFARTRKKSFLEVSDFIAPLVPQGLFWGRMGNFINGELWGKVSDVPWAMVFPTGGPWPRHPSQLYEAVLEGLVMFCVLYALSRRRPARPQGTFMGTFLVLYGVFRFLIEFVRVPDAQLGYLFGPITMGQCLSLPLVVLGVAVLVVSRHLARPQVGHLE